MMRTASTPTIKPGGMSFSNQLVPSLTPLFAPGSQCDLQGPGFHTFGANGAYRAPFIHMFGASGAETPAQKCSLRVTGVGCPERAQVGPLPWLSKSRRSGHLVAFRTPGSLMLSSWATRTSPAALRERANTTRASWAEQPGYGAPRAGRDRPGSEPPASGPGGFGSSETQ